MGKFRVRHALVLAATLLGGGALALPFASLASPTSSSDTSASTTTTTTPTTTGTTGTTTTSTTTTATTKTTAPPPPPNAYDGGVEKVATSSAVLKGAVDPRGLATTYYFQYGPTAAYGAQTPAVAIGSGTATVKVAQTVSNLQPYTTYHFRVLASSPGGTVASKDSTFTTKRIPLSLAVAVAPNPVVFGRPLRVSGAVSGTGSVGVPVVLQADAFPYDRGFHDITSPEAADAAGSFSFPLAGILESTQLRVATVTKPPAYSAVLTELVSVHVALHVRPARHRGVVRLYGTVTPSEPYALVAFERRVGGHYVAVAGTRVHRGSVSRFEVRLRLRHRGLYRALVLTAGGAQVSGRSRALLIR
jgi:hypothetical protein